MENELEKFIAEEERSPDLAAVTRYHLDGLKRALERMSSLSRTKVFQNLGGTWCLDCGGNEYWPCPCTNDE